MSTELWPAKSAPNDALEQEFQPLWVKMLDALVGSRLSPHAVVVYGAAAVREPITCRAWFCKS